MKTIFSDDFSSFPLGPFPYDHDHSAMGEYHYYPEKGYKGAWFDPIADWDYRGPSWLVTAPRMDGKKMMEQMRMTEPKPKKAVPVLRAGETDWRNVTVTCALRAYTKAQPSGLLFRYQTSMMHYAFYLVKDGVELHRYCKQERTVLAKAAAEWSTDDFHTLAVRAEGDDFTCFLDGKEVLRTSDSAFKEGCVALSACMPASYASITVEMSDEEWNWYQEKKEADKSKLEALRASYPKARLVKKIDLKDFGSGRQLRYGHLTGTDELFFVMAQPQLRVYKDRYPFISCLTAFSFETGQVLWQTGTPRDDEDVIALTTDLPFQVYDIDGDGIDEVIASWDFKLFILDGRDGSVKKQMDTPLNTEAPETVTGLEFGKYAFDRLNVDAIRLVNISGAERPEEILIKDRYSRLWVYDKDLNLKWKFQKYNTGHFPYDHDYDGDGKNEVFSCYNMIGSDGKLRWCLPIEQDHTDEIIYGRFDPEGEEALAIVSGWEGFMLVSKDGQILYRDIIGHSQRISAGNYLPSRPGLELCTTTYWGNNGIIYIHDHTGKDIWHREMLCNGNIIAPVNWTGDGRDLILLNASASQGGLMDGEGNIVVLFPDDGHPELSCMAEDIFGDSRDEIIVWDRKSLWVYTPDGPLVTGEKGEYLPEKYPAYNNSNYRGEYSYARWWKEQ